MIVIALWMAVVIGQLPAQTPPRDAPAPTQRRAEGNGVIAGTVSTIDAGRVVPLRRAIVTIVGTGIANADQRLTDDQGRFSFDGLAPGRFTLTAEKVAYLKTYYGSRRPGRPPSTPIVLGVGEHITDVAVSVLRGAVIDGVVRDEFGVPVPGAQVTAQAVSVINGVRILKSASGVQPWAVTDDRGRYRLFGLSPGEYTVRAGGGGVTGNVEAITRAEVDAATRELREPGFNAGAQRPISLAASAGFFPDATDGASAQTFVLSPGDEREGIDIVRRRSATSAASRVEILMEGPDGSPVTRALIGVANVTAASTMFGPGALRPDSNGRAVWQQLMPGTYQFYGRGAVGGQGDDTAMSLWLRTDAIVDGRDMQQIVLRFSEGRSIRGKLQAGGGPTAVDLSRAQLTLEPLVAIAGTAIPTAPSELGADGGFAFTRVPPGTYRLKVSGVPGWTPLAAELRGRDVLDLGFVVTADEDVTGLSVLMTNRPTEIAGLVSDALGRPSPEYSVVVIAAQPELRGAPRRTSSLVKIGPDGRFRVTGLPPGDYLLAVIVDADPEQLQDVEFLEQIAAGAIKITLAEGQSLVQDLKIGG